MGALGKEALGKDIKEKNFAYAESF